MRCLHPQTKGTPAAFPEAALLIPGPPGPVRYALLEGVDTSFAPLHVRAQGWQLSCLVVCLF
jgi:hypothetical protein